MIIINEGYCQCGCGKKTTIYRNKPRKFIQHHAQKTIESRQRNSERMQGNTIGVGRTWTLNEKKQISERQKGENNSNWNGGRTKSSGGYITILKPDHPFADVNGRVKEERLVIEEILGRYLLKEEIVHHKNEIKDDNRPTNLQVMANHKEHSRLHLQGVPRTKEVKHKIIRTKKMRSYDKKYCNI